MPRYRCYGRIVAVSVELDLPQEEFVSAGETPIHIQIEQAPTIEIGGPLDVQRLDSRTALMTVPGFGQFLFNGSEDVLTVRTAEKMDAKWMWTTILNQGLPFALAVQGELVVHAAAIVGKQGAVLLMGRRGIGKSHFAALAVAGGQKILADDFVRLVSGPPLTAMPSFPEIRVYEKEASQFASIAKLSGAAGPKSCLRLDRGFLDSPISVQAIYHIVRNSGGATNGEALSPLDKCQALMDNCLFYPTLRSEDTERRLSLIQQLATSESLVFQRFDLGGRFVKDLNEMREYFNL